MIVHLAKGAMLVCVMFIYQFINSTTLANESRFLHLEEVKKFSIKIQGIGEPCST